MALSSGYFCSAEIAVVDGRKLGKRTTSAFAQSTDSVESAFSQNARSSTSDLKVGIFRKALFGFGIADSFLTVHVTCTEIYSP